MVTFLEGHYVLQLIGGKVARNGMEGEGGGGVCEWWVE